MAESGSVQAHDGTSSPGFNRTTAKRLGSSRIDSLGTNRHDKGRKCRDRSQIDLQSTIFNPQTSILHPVSVGGLPACASDYVWKANFVAQVASAGREPPTDRSNYATPNQRFTIFNLQSKIFNLTSCERGWARTTDPLLKRQMLYP